jgi:hypothetical protein
MSEIVAWALAYIVRPIVGNLTTWIAVLGFVMSLSTVATARQRAERIRGHAQADASRMIRLADDLNVLNDLGVRIDDCNGGDRHQDPVEDVADILIVPRRWPSLWNRFADDLPMWRLLYANAPRRGVVEWSPIEDELRVRGMWTGDRRWDLYTALQRDLHAARERQIARYCVIEQGPWRRSAIPWPRRGQTPPSLPSGLRPRLTGRRYRRSV